MSTTRSAILLYRKARHGKSTKLYKRFVYLYVICYHLIVFANYSVQMIVCGSGKEEVKGHGPVYITQDIMAENIIADSRVVHATIKSNSL